MEIIVHIFSLVILFAVKEWADDPCHTSVPLYRPNIRGTQCYAYQNDFALCDRNLQIGWYKAESMGHSLEIATTCPSAYACGTANPMWMDGILPGVDDGIVKRTVCIRGFMKNDCCNDSIEIQVKNCGSNYVYYLKYPDSCDRAYCFGNDICPQTTLQQLMVSTTTSTNDNNHHNKLSHNDPCFKYSKIQHTRQRGSQCKLYDIKEVICDRLLKPGWYKAEEDGVSLDMPNYCVGSYSCGTAAPIWLNGSLALRPYEMSTKTVCIRGQGIFDCCVAYFEIIVKNCVDYNVYYLPFTNMCDSGYCFGQEECKKERDTNADAHYNTGDVDVKIQALYIAAGILVLTVFVIILYIVYRYGLISKQLRSPKINIDTAQM